MLTECFNKMIKKDEKCLIIEQLSQILIKNKWQVACAESCTGGWVAKSFTDLPGSANWFERGYVTYSNRAKHEMLGVSNQTLEEFGAVSEPVVRQMAEGACKLARVKVSLAISGIAGPTGGTEEKPVGLVWFAWCVDDQLMSHSEIFKGDRDAVRRQAVTTSIERLLTYLQQLVT